jgi:ubiquinone/menaquinone biosynthesis C-methylase UbiE
MDGSWLLDELAHAGPEHLDRDFVAGYGRKQGYPDVDAELDVLRRLGALRTDATVVDLAAGTGRFAVAAAAHCRRVVAVDVSEAMIEHLRARAAEAGVSGLECVRAGFLSYQHQGAPADAVFCRNALHQLPDFWKGIALHRVAQVLRPGGVLRLHDLVYDFQPADAEAALERWMAGAATDPAAGYTRDDFATHIRTEFSTYRWLLEPLLRATGFDIVDSSVQRQIYATYTCVRQ